METLRQCPVCDGAAIGPAFTTEDWWTGAAGSFAVWRCGACDSHFLNPRPDAGELARHYPPGYYSYQAAQPARPAAGGRLRRAAADPLRTWNGLWDRWNKGNAWGRTLLRGERGALLDVGCGAGAFLLHLRALNPALRLVGCDPFGPEAPAGLAEARVEYQRKPLAACGFAGGEFAFVTTSHVLEHLPDPRAAVRELHRVLAPGGRLFAGVPNLRSAAGRLFGARWAGWDAPRHLVDFSAASLAALLRAEGFAVERVRHCGNAAMALDSLGYRLRGKAPPPRWWSGAGRKLAEAALAPLVKAANLARLGDSVEVIAVRR